jgi:23S rRNA-intervening sequence protein
MNGFAERFEDLAVFRRAYALSLEVHRASLDFPRIEQFALADQVRRASKSICATIAEGFGRQRHSKPEFRRFLMMAVGSADAGPPRSTTSRGTSDAGVDALLS